MESKGVFTIVNKEKLTTKSAKIKKKSKKNREVQLLKNILPLVDTP